MPTAPKLTPDQFKAILADLTKDLAPAEPPTESVIQRLVPHRETLVEYRKRGFSIAQLVDLVKAPQIGITVSAVTIRKVLRGDLKPRKRRAPGDAKVVVIPPKTPPAT